MRRSHRASKAKHSYGMLQVGIFRLHLRMYFQRILFFQIVWIWAPEANVEQAVAWWCCFLFNFILRVAISHDSVLAERVAALSLGCWINKKSSRAVTSQQARGGIKREGDVTLDIESRLEGLRERFCLSPEREGALKWHKNATPQQKGRKQKSKESNRKTQKGTARRGSQALRRQRWVRNTSSITADNNCERRQEKRRVRTWGTRVTYVKQKSCSDFVKHSGKLLVQHWFSTVYMLKRSRRKDENVPLFSINYKESCYRVHMQIDEH